MRCGTVLRVSSFYVGLHVPLELRAEGTEGTLEWLVSQVAPDVPLQVISPAASPPTYWTVKLPTTAKLKSPTTIRVPAFLLPNALRVMHHARHPL